MAGFTLFHSFFLCSLLWGYFKICVLWVADSVGHWMYPAASALLHFSFLSSYSSAPDVGSFFYGFWLC